MSPWFWYTVGAAVLYDAHQIFTRLASNHFGGDGIGNFVVEATATLTILLYLGRLYFTVRCHPNSPVLCANFRYDHENGHCSF